MNCQSCGSQLTKEARACPNCGTLTPAYYANDAGANDPTVPSASAQGPRAPYGSNPYSSTASVVGLQQPEASYGSNPYDEQSNPYSTSVPLLPPRVPRKKKRVLIVGIILLVLVLLTTGTFVWLGWFPPQRNPQTLSKLKLTEAQALYDQTTYGTPSLDSTLAGPDNYGWDNYSEANTSCAFSGNAYHAQAKPRYFSPCYAKATNYSDFIFQAQATIVNGHSAGIVFRADSTNDKAYQFRVSTDGTYILNIFSLDSRGLAHGTTLSSGHSSSITAGANQPNLLSVIAQGTYIYLFVNNKYVDRVSDNTYQSGQIGTYVDSDSEGVEATFRNIKVWKL